MALNELFTEIANSIRAKNNTTEKIIASDFPKEIEKIDFPLQEKSVMPNEQVQEVVPDEGIYGLSKVIVGRVDLRELTNDATATAKDILEGKTAYVDGNKIIGIMSDTGIVEKQYSIIESGDYILNSITPNKILGSEVYGVAFSEGGKYCARLITEDSIVKLGLFSVSEGVLYPISIYDISGTIITGNINGTSVTVQRFVMINEKGNENKCYLYIRGINDGTQKWNSIIPIDFESDTPIIAENVVQFSSGDGVLDDSILLIPYQPTKCVRLVYINDFRLDLYIAEIDYMAKTVTNISSVLELNARSAHFPCYSFSEDGRSLVIGQREGRVGNNNAYAPYLIRFAKDFNSFTKTQFVNGNPGSLCINKNGTLAFMNGKLFSIDIIGDETTSDTETVTLTKVGTVDVIAPFGNYDTDVSGFQPYFTLEDSVIVVMSKTKGVKLYNIDLKGETTAGGTSLSTVNIFFSCQCSNKENVYGLGVYTGGKLICGNFVSTIKELTALVYNGETFVKK